MSEEKYSEGCRSPLVGLIGVGLMGVGIIGFGVIVLSYTMSTDSSQSNYFTVIILSIFFLISGSYVLSLSKKAEELDKRCPSCKKTGAMQWHTIENISQTKNKPPRRDREQGTISPTDYNTTYVDRGCYVCKYCGYESASEIRSYDGY